MHRRFIAFLFVLIICFVSFASVAGARPNVSSVSLIASTPTYSGPCPIDIVFVATINGDAGTVIGFKFSGPGFPPTKTLFSYIPISGTVSINDTVTVDAAHSGTFDREVEITPYESGSLGSSPEESIKPKPFTVSVVCSPAQQPSTSVGASPSPMSTTALHVSLDGVSVGEDPATVLARLGLHAPGWAAGAPKGSTSVGEVREFKTDGGNATMMLFFAAAIQVVMVRAIANTKSSITDPYGVALNDPLDHLLSVRGSADIVEQASARRASENANTEEHAIVGSGLHYPVDSDFTYIYGRDDGIRWEYTIKDKLVTSIRVVDCRVAGMCTATKQSTTP